MATELRKTGISVVGDVPWGTHYCYFYETTQDLLDTLVPYFKAGLESNEFCLWIISKSELLTAEEAKEALRQALPDLERYLAAGSMEIVSHDEWFQDSETFDPHKVANRFKEKLGGALARGYDGLRINGGPAWLQKEDRKQFLEFEQQLNELFPSERMIASCTYPLASTNGDDLFDVTRRHQFAIAKRRGQWEVYETPELKQAKAEIERLNEELEQRVCERTSELAATNDELRSEIAERKRAEQRLKQSETQLAEGQRLAHVGSWDWDLRSDSVTWSDELYRIFGLQPGETEVPQLATAFIHPKDRDLVLSTVKSAVKNKEPYSFYYRILRRDGEERIVQSRGQMLSDEHGEPIRVFGATQDVTELKRAEEKLQATSEQLRALSARVQSVKEEEATRIAREIHDELGSALTRLKWDLELMNKENLQILDEEKLADLWEKTAAMSALVDGTIEVVRRISAELRPSVLDDLGLIAAIRWHTRKFQEGSGIAMECDCSLAEPALSQQQSTAVFRIFEEALTNALRHAQAKRVEVKVEKDAGELIVTIRDNGRGITDEEKSDRLSLGLVGMRERAALIGGHIEITGTKEQGTVVSVRVPIS